MGVSSPRGDCVEEAGAFDREYASHVLPEHSCRSRKLVSKCCPHRRASRDVADARFPRIGLMPPGVRKKISPRHFPRTAHRARSVARRWGWHPPFCMALLDLNRKNRSIARHAGRERPHFTSNDAPAGDQARANQLISARFAAPIRSAGGVRVERSSALTFVAKGIA